MAPAPVDAQAIFPAVRNGVATGNGGGNVFLVSSRFTLAGHHADLLLGMLPPIVQVRAGTDRTALRWSVKRMAEKLREGRPGNTLVAEHLAPMVLVQALRLYLAEGVNGGVGWLFPLADKQVGAAIAAMHDDPAHRWTLPVLARRAAMSRSTLALGSKDTVGQSSMAYLTRWRMLLAGSRLERSGDPVSAIARSLGYGSESAFRTAFKRVVGCRPGGTVAAKARAPDRTANGRSRKAEGPSPPAGRMSESSRRSGPKHEERAGSGDGPATVTPANALPTPTVRATAVIEST